VIITVRAPVADRAPPHRQMLLPCASNPMHLRLKPQPAHKVATVKAVNPCAGATDKLKILDGVNVSHITGSTTRRARAFPARAQTLLRMQVSRSRSVKIGENICVKTNARNCAEPPDR